MNETDLNRKIEITDEIRDRLTSLEQNKGINHIQLISLTGIKSNSYKNLFHTSGSQKYIKYEMLKAIADFYGCSVDYIIGKSKIFRWDSSAQEIPKSPLNFNIRGQKIQAISTFLRSSENAALKYEFVKNLEFIINNLSEEECTKIIEGFNTSISLLRENTVFQFKNELSPTSLEALVRAFKEHDKDYLDIIKEIGEALDAHNKNRYKKSLFISLRTLLKCLGIECAEIDCSKTSCKGLYAMDLIRQIVGHILSLYDQHPTLFTDFKDYDIYGILSKYLNKPFPTKSITNEEGRTETDIDLDLPKEFKMEIIEYLKNNKGTK